MKFSIEHFKINIYDSHSLSEFYDKSCSKDDISLVRHYGPVLQTENVQNMRNIPNQWVASDKW